MSNPLLDDKKTYIPCNDCDLKSLCKYMPMVREASAHLPVDDKVFVACEYFKQGYVKG